MSALEREEENLQTIVGLIDQRIAVLEEELSIGLKRLKALRDEESEKLLKVQTDIALLHRQSTPLAQAPVSVAPKTPVLSIQPPPLSVAQPQQLSSTSLSPPDLFAETTKNMERRYEEARKEHEKLLIAEGRRIEALPGKNTDYSRCQFSLNPDSKQLCINPILCKKVCRIHYHRLQRLGLMKGDDGDTKSPEKKKRKSGFSRIVSYSNRAPKVHRSATATTASTTTNKHDSDDNESDGEEEEYIDTDPRDISMPLK